MSSRVQEGSPAACGWSRHQVGWPRAHSCGRSGANDHYSLHQLKGSSKAAHALCGWQVQVCLRWTYRCSPCTVDYEYQRLAFTVGRHGAALVSEMKVSICQL